MLYTKDRFINRQTKNIARLKSQSRSLLNIDILKMKYVCVCVLEDCVYMCHLHVNLIYSFCSIILLKYGNVKFILYKSNIYFHVNYALRLVWAHARVVYYLYLKLELICSRIWVHYITWTWSFFFFLVFIRTVLACATKKKPLLIWYRYQQIIMQPRGSNKTDKKIARFTGLWCILWAILFELKCLIRLFGALNTFHTLLIFSTILLSYGGMQ